MFQIKFYEKENGEIPVEIFLESLDERMQTKAVIEIELLERYGNTLREPHVKYIDDNIFELRIRTGSNISRVFYFFFTQKRIVLTNGFIKKTQKTPDKEIKKAKEYKKDYIRRFKDGV